MPVSARRIAGSVVAALGISLAVLGTWMAVKLGPAGAAQLSVTSSTPGAIVVAADVLNRVDVPVRVQATRSDGGSVRVTVAPGVDARSVLAGSAVSTVTGVRYPAGTLDLRRSGAGPAVDIGKADVWRIAAKGPGSAELVVDQGRGPETAVVSSGDATSLKDVSMTLTWANRSWFFDALSMAIIGAIITAVALAGLWRGRAVTGRSSEGSGAATSSEATT